MIKDALIERYNQCIKGLNRNLYEPLYRIPERIKKDAQEIRLRTNRPVSICSGNITYFVTKNNQITTTVFDENMLIASKQDIMEVFQNICSYSVYSRQKEIVNGFITLNGGHRAGICGTAVYNQDNLTNVRDISSINFRISREIKGIAQTIIEKIGTNYNGILLCGVPASGKTTMLRDLARILSMEHKFRVTVVDERGELAGVYSGVCQNDIGFCDVLDGYKKSDGIIRSLRSMSPNIIICDEVGGEEDIKAIEEAVNSGVAFIASVHCRDKFDFIKRPQCKRLLNTGAFDRFVFLQCRNAPGEIAEICTLEDIKNAENLGNFTDNHKHNGNRGNVFPPLNYTGNAF